MAILALAAWALQQQIRLFLSVAKLPKKQNQLSSIKTVIMATFSLVS